jgi:hypothetical protein
VQNHGANPEACSGNQMPLLLEKTPNCQRSSSRVPAAKPHVDWGPLDPFFFPRKRLGSLLPACPAVWVGIHDFRDSRLAVKGGFSKIRKTHFGVASIDRIERQIEASISAEEVIIGLSSRRARGQ